YVDHFGNCITNITKQQMKDVGKGRDFDINFGTKGVVKGVKRGYSDWTLNERFTLKTYEGEKLALFNEAGFLEIAVFRSNPNTVGSASTLLGLKFRDAVTVVFKAP
ncbi:MAG: hypothetical protein EOP54_27765, partial [Sphingobacteriales bacterium]